ncbi:MAG: S9 family peptidase [Gammaproteobacteria bacterium]|nr:S9 family peptidase [Gammaproteobacteria bacterium]MDE2070274.1 S9 family peptidase [Gammaproteobacteria bacterium]
MKRAPRIAACGSWRSPLSAAQIAATGVRLAQPRIAGEHVYWLESRPAENGRSVLVRVRPDEPARDLTPAPFSVRSRVHEYGGGAFAVTMDTAYFVNDADQQVYGQRLEDTSSHVLTAAPGCRFADLQVDAIHRRLIAICEDHRQDTRAPKNTLQSIGLADGRLATLAQGYDFYSSPALNPDGRQLAWLCWNAPLMPWEGCELWLAAFDAGGVPIDPWRVAGGSEESIFQPQFAPDGALHFISDRDGFWNIYRYADGKIRAVTCDAMDYGFAQWNFGMSSYGFLDDGSLCAVRCRQGCSELVHIGADDAVHSVRRELSQIEHVHVHGNQLALLAADSTHPPAVIWQRGKRELRLTRDAERVPANALSTGEFVSFPTTNGETAYCWYYPPYNPEFRASPGEKPPLLVKCHGGPTAMSGNGLDLRVQFWTSRGFAVADVNYRGSSGFGRAYRASLRGQWGIKDSEDCMAAARCLVERGWVDSRRLAISGSSAGGFTALCALAFHDFFRVGAVYYGISELESAMRDTHKFEAHYGDSLLGPWPGARETYRLRSPLHAAANIRCPVIFFQGLKDKVAPPDQTQRMVQALRINQVPVKYLEFPEEGHGFRRRETLQRTLEAELAFYGQVFGFTPAMDS